MPADPMGTFNQVVSGKFLKQALIRGLIVEFDCHLGWLPLLLTRQNVLTGVFRVSYAFCLAVLYLSVL